MTHRASYSMQWRYRRRRTGYEAAEGAETAAKRNSWREAAAARKRRGEEVSLRYSSLKSTFDHHCA